ncbi:cytochrome P450 [Rhizodiscina lignyota]|uniref:Cytochrome P450 n=1 Tax=Rhizodiscina lignyota TaxID=1504668 RepID=A0A9P4IC56_9PEZI|nr:cytochrome P450 [Rhizodiscina lignyota]
MAIGSILVVVLSLASAWLLNFAYRMYRHRRRFRDLRGPPHSWLWGHLKVMGEAAATLPPNMHPQAYLTVIAQKYNLDGLFYLDLWPAAEPQLVLTSPELLDQVTVTRVLPIHQMADDYLAPMVGRNVVAAANGPVWKKLHNSMVPAFSWSHIRSLTTVFVDECMHFRNTLDQLAKTGETFSMEDTSAKLVFDIIGKILFNFSLNAQTEGSSYLEDLREMIHLAENQLSWNPFVHISTFFRRRVVLARLNPSIMAQIKNRLSMLRQDQIVPSRKDPYSILDLMLREQLQDGGELKEGKDVEDISPEWLELLLANVKGLLVGGHGTTTDTLCYIYILLSKNPEVIQKLREEHSRILHPDFNETLNILQASPHKLEELEYTGAVIRETLRLFPVGFSVRQAEDDATISYAGKQYAMGNVVVVNTPHTLQYDPKIYPKPDEFIPDRWMDPDNMPPRNAFRTFSRGARACLGQNLAVNELKVILVMTLRDYDFEIADLVPNKEPRTSYTKLDTIYGDRIFQELAMEAKPPRGGTMMRVRKRS